MREVGLAGRDGPAERIGIKLASWLHFLGPHNICFLDGSAGTRGALSLLQVPEWQPQSILEASMSSLLGFLAPRSWSPFLVSFLGLT